jgi:hypothetical protein
MGKELSRTFGKKRFDFLFIAIFSQSLEPPDTPGRFRRQMVYCQQLWIFGSLFWGRVKIHN